MDEDYDDIEIDLRPAHEIARRMTVLAATGRRLELEYAARDGNYDESYAAETDRFELNSWTQSTLSDWLTISERSLLQSPVGELDHHLLDEHSFDTESALALGWALGVIDSLPVDAIDQTPVDGLRVLAPKPWDKADALDKRLRARTESDVWEERERWYLIRLRGLLGEAESGPDRRAAIQDVVADGVWACLATRSGDFLVGPVMFDELNDDDLAHFLGTTDAYLRALTWACGLGTSWDDVPLDDL